MEEHPGGEKAFRIGRVCTKRTERGQGHTNRLMQAALAEVGDYPCRINAQTYLEEMYAKHGSSATAMSSSTTASRTCRWCARIRIERADAVIRPYPFSAIVGHDQLRLALVLCAVRPEIGGVLIRGEKGTAKSTAVRGLADVLAHVDDDAPGRAADRRHRGPGRRIAGPAEGAARRGARVLARPAGRAHTAACSTSTRSTCCTTTWSTCCWTPPRWAGCTSSATASRTRHEARFVLIGTMNPEEGELRPQLLDRFGLTVDVRASRDVDVRVEVIRQRLAYEADPDGIRRRYADADAELAAPDRSGPGAGRRCGVARQRVAPNRRAVRGLRRRRDAGGSGGGAYRGRARRLARRRHRRRGGHPGRRRAGAAAPAASRPVRRAGAGPEAAGRGDGAGRPSRRPKPGPGPPDPDPDPGRPAAASRTADIGTCDRHRGIRRHRRPPANRPSAAPAPAFRTRALRGARGGGGRAGPSVAGP